MIEWEPNKNDVNLNMPVDGQVASICWNEQTKLLTMSLAYSAVYGMGERYNGLNQNDRIQVRCRESPNDASSCVRMATGQSRSPS